MEGRFEVFNEIEKDLKSSDEYRELKENKLGTLISPVPLTPSEVEKNPSILLDIVMDGIMLYEFMSGVSSDLARKRCPAFYGIERSDTPACKIFGRDEG